MRPCYRLPAKRVLPTIREGYEELVHDMNQAKGGSHCSPIAPPQTTLGDPLGFPQTHNSIDIQRQTLPGPPGNNSTQQQQIESHSPTNTQLHPQTQHLSTQDYLLSICQLARPAFSQSEADWGIHNLGSQAAARTSRPRDQQSLLLPTPPQHPQQPQVIQGKYKKLVPQTKNSCTTEADVETQDHRDMEDSSNPGSLAPDLDRTLAKPGPLISDPLEALYGRADSFLTAARLTRGGWREEGKDTGWQFSHPLSTLGCSLPHPSLSNQEGPQGPSRPEICLKDPSASHSPVQNFPPAHQSPSSIGALTHRLLLQGHVDSTPSGRRGDWKQFLNKETGVGRKTTRDRETGCDRQTDAEKPMIKGRQTGVLSVNRQQNSERQAGLGSQTGVVSIWVSGCRSTWRQSRRLKAPILPAIAEL